MSKKNGNDPLVVSIDKEIEAEVGAIAALDAQRAEHQKRLRSLRSARKALGKKDKSGTLTPQRIAGPKVIAAVRDVLAAGPTRQADITHKVGANSGSISYAIKALLDEGAIVATGATIGGSKEFALADDRSVVPPR